MYLIPFLESVFFETVSPYLWVCVPTLFKAFLQIVSTCAFTPKLLVLRLRVLKTMGTVSTFGSLHYDNFWLYLVLIYSLLRNCVFYSFLNSASLIWSNENAFIEILIPSVNMLGTVHLNSLGRSLIWERRKARFSPLLIKVCPTDSLHIWLALIHNVACSQKQ